MTQTEAIDSSTVTPRPPLGRRLRIGLSGGLLALTMFLAGNHLAALDKASAMRSSPAYAATPIPNPALNGTTQLANLVCSEQSAPTQYAP